MSQQGLYGKQIHPVLIQMGAESMAEGMAGKAAFPAELVLMGMDMSGKEKGINGPVLSVLFREEVTPWFPICKPVLREQVKSRF